MQFGRFFAEKPVNYTPQKVLLGNWVEDRHAYEKTTRVPDSTYNSFFTTKTFEGRPDSAIVWDAIFQSDGYGPRIITDMDGKNYMDNYSSTYDLSYRHYPKLARKMSMKRKMRSRMDRYEPEVNFTLNHGPITTFGLRKYYKEKWRCDLQDPRTTLKTSYGDDYMPLPDEAYRFKKWATPLSNSSKVSAANEACIRLNLRNNTMCNVKNNDELVVVPGDIRCNPITWECQDEIIMPIRCVEKKENPNCPCSRFC